MVLKLWDEEYLGYGVGVVFGMDFIIFILIGGKDYLCSWIICLFRV